MASTARSTRRLHRGFTLIELMIVVTIIGLLATVAIPEFLSLTRRTKRSEREIMISGIMRTVNDYWLAKGTLPGGNTPDLPPNPPYGASGVADGVKYPFDSALGAWGELNWRPDGLLYFHYSITGSVPLGVLFVTAESDLDNDGLPSIKMVTYTLEEGTWQVREAEELGDDF